VQAFLDGVARVKMELHSLMLVRHGSVVAEGWWTPYGPEFNHWMYSMSKSFTSTAVGLAAAEGKLSIEDKVVSFFPQDLPAQVGEGLAAMRVKHLLMMAAGHAKEPTTEMVGSEDWARVFLGWPVEHTPGTTFLYNSGATYMCSAIVQRVTGQRVVDYLRPRLFEPLGISGIEWETCPRGVNVGGWGLCIPTEGLAKFGQLYLQRGEWRGRRIIPAAWVDEATTFKIQQPQPAQPSRPAEKNDWTQGYCYQFWRATHHAFRGDGAFGQFTLVLPEKDAVVIMTAESHDLQGQLDLVWEHLLPALRDQPFAPVPGAEESLAARLAGLTLPTPAGTGSSPTAGRIAGQEFQLEPNDLGLVAVVFDHEAGASRIRFKSAQGDHVVACGTGGWQRGETALPGSPPRLVSGGASPAGTKFKVAAAAAWKDENTLEAVLRYYETPHHDTLTCHFDGSSVSVAFANSIAGSGPSAKDKRGVLRGKLKAGA